MPSPQPASGMPSSATKRMGVSPVIVLLVAGACFIVGYAAGSSLGNKVGFASGKQQGMDEARASLAAKFNPDEFPPLEETMSVSGSVTDVTASGLVMNVGSLTRNPLEEPTPASRTVRINAETKIVRVTMRTPDEMSKEFAAFDAASATDPSVMPPDPHVVTPATIADVKPGSRVSVVASQDIARAAAFDAVEIRITADPEPEELPPPVPTEEPVAEIQAEEPPPAE